MLELIAAAFIGAVLAALHHTKRGKMKMLRVGLTGFALSIFTVSDIVNFILHLTNFQASKGGIIFVVAFAGSEILERVILIIRNFNANVKWNRNDDS